MVDSLHLGRIIKDTGDLGRFQLLTLLVVELSIIGHGWSLLFMSFGGASPDRYWCDGDGVYGGGNGTTVSANTTTGACKADNVTSCTKWTFSEEKRTIVSEFQLVCDRKWIKQTITTIQFVGMLVGAFAWGHICDAIGRKLTFFIGLLIVAISNLIGLFSVNWQMFATLRFFIAIGISGVNASSVLFEFVRNKWRFWLGSIPFYAIIGGLLALFCYYVHDWRYIHVGAAAGAFLPFVGWRLIPESYRWLIARGRFDEAAAIVKRMATMNGKPVPDMVKLRQQIEEDKYFIEHQKSLRIYTVIDVLRTWKLLKMTLLFGLIWFADMFSYFGITFDVPSLSGNLYLNMFLVIIADMPGAITVAIFNIKFGRKYTSLVLAAMAGICCLVVGGLQYSGASGVSSVITVFVIAAKYASNAQWIATATWTLESYPTVIRHIGKGVVDTLSRMGAILAPQFITLSEDIHGLLYFVSGGILIIAALACLVLEETKSKDLEDILPVKRRGRKPSKADEYYTKHSEIELS